MLSSGYLEHFLKQPCHGLFRIVWHFFPERSANSLNLFSITAVALMLAILSREQLHLGIQDIVVIFRTEFADRGVKLVISDAHEDIRVGRICR